MVRDAHEIQINAQAQLPPNCCGRCRFGLDSVDPQSLVKRRICMWGPPTPVPMAVDRQGTIGITNLRAKMRLEESCHRFEPEVEEQKN